MVEFRRDWLESIQTMQQEMAQLLDHFARRKPPLVRYSPRAWEPAVNMYETTAAVVVLVELAGVPQENIHIRAHARTLVLTGERVTREMGDEKTYHQLEISTGRFERSLVLPAQVDADRAMAAYHDGILEIVLPKLSKARIRRIDVRKR